MAHQCQLQRSSIDDRPDTRNHAAYLRYKIVRAVDLQPHLPDGPALSSGIGELRADRLQGCEVWMELRYAWGVSPIACTVVFV